MQKKKKPLSKKVSAPLTKAGKSLSKSIKKLSTHAPNNTKKSTPKTSSIEISGEEIALRAYFISERRRELGWGGNEESDWIEAEKQLFAEALEALKKK